MNGWRDLVREKEGDMQGVGLGGWTNVSSSCRLTRTRESEMEK